MEKILKIKTSLAKPGMIIGKDIYSVSEHFIAGAGTRLTDRMITRLKFYFIEELFIVNPDYSEEQPKKTAPKKQPESIPSEAKASYYDDLRQTPEFRQFTKTFYTSLVSFKEQMNTLVQDKTPLKPEELLTDVSKILASCQNPNTLFDMMMCIRNIDDATYVHSMNVALICTLFATWTKMTKEDAQCLTLAGLLHDIGKMMIPKEILAKPGKLTEEEYKIVQGHPQFGYNILKAHNADIRICNAALMHHERCDGHGYPNKLPQKQIEPFAKIVAIADVYDALTSSRCYRGPVCPLEVIGVFQTEGLTQYDVRYLLLFLDQVMYSYLHHTVRLNTGEVGKIVLMDRNSLSRPVISISKDRFIDLRTERNITITEVI